MSRHISLVSAVALMVLIMVGCSSTTTPVPETTAVPTTTAVTLAPTAEPSPTSTPTPTEVPPTSTPAAPVTVLSSRPLGLEDVVVEGDGWEMPKGTFEVVDAVAPPDGDGSPAFDKALRVETLEEPSRLIDLRLLMPAERAVNRDDVLWLSFYARAVNVNPLEPLAYIKVYFQQAYPILHWMRPMDKVVPIGADWQHVTLPFVAKENHEAGAAAVYFAFGFPAQMVEIGGVELIDYGTAVDPETLPKSAAYDGYAWGTIEYGGRESDAAWRAEAEERIETYRKGDLTIRVEDAQGNAVPNAEVLVGMTRHAYGFGSAVAAKWLIDPSEDGDAYRAVVADHYNKIVFENDLKYGPWEDAKTAAAGDYFVRANTFASLEWLTERDIDIRGHTLIWGPIRKSGYNRNFDFENNAEAAREALLAHLEERLTETRPDVQEWDVINHPVATFGDLGNRLDLVYGSDFYVEAMNRARAAHPDLVAYVNEGNILTGGGRQSDAYEDFIQYLIDQGAGPDGIGFMGHFDEATLVSPEILMQRMDRFAEFGLPLQVTEFDVDTGDVKAQADYLRDFMTVVFSHPATEGMIMWGFWAGQHWRPAAALYQQDWTLKPNGQMWLNLVKEQWWTEAMGVTDASGQYATRGFLGDYEITVKVDGGTQTVPVTLIREGTDVVVTWE